jgi:hypothetical protein
MLWAGDLKYERLVVLLADLRRVDESRALCAAARRTAAAAGLREVRAWEQPGLDGGTLVPRDGALPMIRALAAPAAAAGWCTIPRAIWI